LTDSHVLARYAPRDQINAEVGQVLEQHLPCKAKVRQPAYVCTACGDEVPRDTAGKGYEYAKG
jgi:non-homologous end joining protein Ku